MKSKKFSVILLFAVFLGIVVGLILASNLHFPVTGNAANQPVVTLGSTEPVSDELAGLEKLSKAFVRVAKEVSPAIVTINSQVVIKQRHNQTMDDEFFRYFFRVPEQEDQVRRGLGSGVIINSDGYILTNNHVVSEADKITVVIDKVENEAKVIGTDPESDLAVIKIEKTGLPTIKLGDSDALEVGEWILAVGNPFSDALQHTVTAGIVSAKGRSNLPISGGRIQYQDFIQTDAAINPGNSGGAMVNLRGELVGINTAILGQANVGIGFAIPINLAKTVMEQLIKEGKVVRGWLGVYIESVGEDMAKAFDMKDPKGALVQRVVENGPAAKADIQAGDIIIKVNDTVIESSDQLTNLVATFTPDTKVDVVVWRDGKEKQVTVKLGERPQGGAPQDVEAEKGAENKLGIEVQNLTSELAQRFGYEGDAGVLITDVQSGSVAEREGLQSGDLVMTVNRVKVSNVAEFNRVVGKLEAGQIVLLRLKREDMSFFRTLRIPKN
jgi:serine protease Do